MRICLIIVSPFHQNQERCTMSHDQSIAALEKRIEQLERENAELSSLQEALYHSNQLIERILDAMPVRVFWKDRDLRYLGCNSLFARDAGFSSPDEVIGKDDYEMGWRDQAAL